ncbi:unnamed protein product [Moneuplotes crassus]|uniref:Uncharacterized protein n=1 Tax=Euplotes crassus TaxID=5936 RepID=A0AAD1Y4U9_EUPCR|nr:unnamed protein product [Moneuplotes crassus]
MESENKITQENHDQAIGLEKSILVESIKQQYQRCCCIYYNTHLREIKAKLPDPESNKHCVNHQLQIAFALLRYMNLMKKLKLLKFSNIKKAGLHIGKMRNKHILNFVDFSLPNKMEELDVYLTFEKKLNRATYFNSLVRISSKVTRRVGFQFFCLSLNQLKRLVAAYRHVKILDIWDCKLSIPTVPDFSRALQNCQVLEISLSGTGYYYHSNWKDHPEEFKNLIQGFATSSDLKLSLRKVTIEDCEIKKSEAQKIFAEYQFEGVEITDVS